MKNCPNCNAVLDDNAAFCTGCGFSINAQQTATQGENPNQQGYNPNQQGYNNPNQQAYNPNQQQYNQQGGQYYAQQPYVNPLDHTSEFDLKDISDNKVIAMLPYLTGYIGIIIALIAASQSKYVAFHVRQALKLSVTATLIGIAMSLLVWTILVPLAGIVCLGIIFVLKIIAFFQICSGKAKEPAIVGKLGFLK